MKKSSGFTLIELMITVGIIGVLTAIAIPSVRVYLQNSRLTTNINTLVSHLAFARSEAITQSQQVVLCASTNGVSCAGNNWASGWIVFSDLNADGAVNNPADTVLRVQQPLGNNNTLTSANIAAQVIYDNRGFTSTPAGTFSLCDDRGAVDINNVRSIAISNTGRVRQVHPSENPAC